MNRACPTRWSLSRTAGAPLTGASAKPTRNAARNAGTSSAAYAKITSSISASVNRTCRSSPREGVRSSREKANSASSGTYMRSAATDTITRPSRMGSGKRPRGSTDLMTVNARKALARSSVTASAFARRPTTPPPSPCRSTGANTSRMDAGSSAAAMNAALVAG